MYQKLNKVKGKKAIYAFFGIEYVDGKILAPFFGWIKPLLKKGNSKTGSRVKTWSILPGTGKFTAMIDGKTMCVNGTCNCDCTGCYAKAGFYKTGDVIRSNFINTYLARNYTDFVKRAIIAQIYADKIEMVRIHAAGDFFCSEYIDMWKDIVSACEKCAFWTYTKNSAAENAFDDFSNANIVKSIIPGIGINFGHCDYIIDAYNKLTAAGENVYICRCGIDDTQHCENCAGCSKNKYVLFIEHSTEYKAKSDPLYNTLADIIEKQPVQLANGI